MYSDKKKKVTRSQSGFSSIYKTQEFKERQKTFEKNLGVYACKHPKAYYGVDSGINRMKKVLYDYYKEDYYKENYLTSPTGG